MLIVAATVAGRRTTRPGQRTMAVRKCARVTIIPLRTGRTPVHAAADKAKVEVKIAAVRSTAVTNLTVVYQANGLTRVRPFFVVTAIQGYEGTIRSAEPQ